MVSGSRSTRRNKDEVNDAYGKGCRGSDDSGLRMRETRLSREMTQNPQSKQNSKRLGEPISLSTTRMTKKSARVEKHSTPCSLRRSYMNKINMSSSSSSKLSTGSKLSTKDKKVENLILVCVDTEKTEEALESVGVNQKIMDARSFKSLFKSQRIKVVFPDVDRVLQGRGNTSYICNSNSKGIAYEPKGNGEDISNECSKIVGKLRDQSIGRASDGDLHKSTKSSKGCDADNDANINSNHIDYVVDEILEHRHGDGLKDSRINSGITETYSNAERLPTNLTVEDTNASDPGSSTCFERSDYCAIGSGSRTKCSDMKVGVPSPYAECEAHNLLWTCVICNKKKRVSYGSREQELCSCSDSLDEGLNNFCAAKGRGDRGAALSLGSAENYCGWISNKETNGHEKHCVICDKDDGEFLFCGGHGCNRRYHLSCLYALPGVWHCPECVYKKLALGVHSVSKGVESIWDVREVQATNDKGMHRQKQYFVKYQDLAHVHNHWVSEHQLYRQSFSLLSNFIAKDKIVRWSADWTVPHRLLRKRPLHKFHVSSPIDMSECHYEWLVKWHGLNYNDLTWELDNAYFLRSTLGQKLVKDYEIRIENANKLNKHHKGSFVALPELLPSESPVNDSNLLKNVNELRDCWFKSQNAVVCNNQDRAVSVVLFIQSLTAMCQPFLIVSASESVRIWETEFARLAPAVDVVVYGGNRETRKVIRASEFYEGGDVMLQVLLSSSQAVLEDLDLLRCIRWEAIVIDDYQHSMVLDTLKSMKTLDANLTIVLINNRKETQDSTPEYLNLLHWLESRCDFDKLRCLNFDKDNTPFKLERLPHCTSNESTSEVSKFAEYWVPVQISNYQLELYCDALFSSNALCSSSRSDFVGALRDTLLTVRKCCDHPYLVDSSIQKALVAEKHPAAEILDVGIKASGKLHLLDLMLSEIKTQGLQVLILYQMIVGSEGATIGDILDDFLHQRFGGNTYERVDARVINSRKQAAMDRFNKRESGQFVFLLENRACSSAIKLSCLDLIIIYDSDWNPANDLRALQKISIDSNVVQIKVFRLYSSYTVEERALVLAKQNLNLDNGLQNLSRVKYDSLLMWGASYLFSKLDEYHAASNSTDFRILSGQLLLNEINKEFHSILSDNCETIDINPLISKVTFHNGCYKSNAPNFGEAKIQLVDGIEPYVFWKNLLDRKQPQWKHLKGPCPRNRKRVQCLVEPTRSLGCENGEANKKRKRVASDSVDPSFIQVDMIKYPIAQVAGSKEGNCTTVASNQFQASTTNNARININPNSMCEQSSFHTHETEERFSSLHKQKSLPSLLQEEVTRLCQLLKFSDNVVQTARKFLEYVIKNRDARSDSPAIMQAFQLSLCWVAALISKQKVDKKHSFLLAKQHLNYQCTEEQVKSVYSKMQSLKCMYLQCSQGTKDSGKDCLSDAAINNESSDINVRLHRTSPSFELKNVKIDTQEELPNGDHHEAHISLHKKVELMFKAAGSEIRDIMKKKQKKCEKRMKKLIQKQHEELRELQRTMDEQRIKVEENHKLESAITRSIQDQGSTRMSKLQSLDDNFVKKMEEYNLLRDMQLKDLEARQLAARNEESQKALNWLAEAMACSSKPRNVNGLQKHGFQSEDDIGYSQLTHITLGGSREMVGKSQQELRDQNLRKNMCAPENYVTPSISVRNVVVGCNDPTEAESVDSDHEMGIMSSERLLPVSVEQLDPLNRFDDENRDTSATTLFVSGALVSDEIRVAELNKGDLTRFARTAFNEVVEHVDDVVLSVVPSEGDLIGLPNSQVNRRDEPSKMADGGLAEHHVSDNKIFRHSVSAEQQEQEPAVEIPSTSVSEVATLELVDTATSNGEESIIGSLLHPVPIDVPLSCSQSQLSETEYQIQNQERRFSQSAEAWETEDLCNEFISQSCGESQLHGNQLDRGPSSGSVELITSVPNSTAFAQAVARTAELPSQAVLQLGLDVNCLNGPSRNHLRHPFNQVGSWNSPPSSLAEPLEDESERLRKEAQQLEKVHEDMMSQLRSDCEKEIEEIIAEIRFKYEVKIKDAEAEFILKKTEVEKNQNIVLMNKKLAEAFRSKCLDLKSSRCPEMRQAFSSSFMQQPHPPNSHSARFPSVDSVNRPPVCQQITVQYQQDMLSQQPISNVVSSSVAGRNVAVPASIQAVSHAQPQTSGPSSRPPVISGTATAANPHFGRGILSPAPHLQPFRPLISPRVGAETLTASQVQIFRPAAARPRTLHQHFPPKK